MPILELRDSETAKAFVLQSLMLQRTFAPNIDDTGRAFDWALEMLSNGDAIPPLGFLVDVGRLAFTSEENEDDSQKTVPPNTPASLVRGYEDYVLGKLYADSSFERGVDGLAKFSDERDRSKGLAFLVSQIMRRSNVDGVLLSPSIVRQLQATQPDELLTQALQMLEEQPLELVTEAYSELTVAIRQTGDVLGPEDIFELEHGTALAGFGQRVALPQLLRVRAEQAEKFPMQPKRNRIRQQKVSTNIRDEDTYPVGGFTSISNRGSIESLLQSQLSYMETDKAAQPDLFAIKFLRDELLYYSRDDNEFFRERRSFVIVISADIVESRVKDPSLPCQRLVMGLGVLVAVVDQLIDWLGDHALRFEFVLIDDPIRPALADEHELLEMIFREQIANGTVFVKSQQEPNIDAYCEELARTSRCHCIQLAVRDDPIAANSYHLTRIVVAGAQPVMGVDEEPLEPIDAIEDLDAWFNMGRDLVELLL